MTLPNVEELTIDVGDNKLQAALVLGRPDRVDDSRQHPGVLLISGIPRQNENNPSAPLFNPTFGPMSQQLSEAGVNSMVMSPAGVGKSSGDTFAESLESRANSWVAAAETMIASGQTDPTDISIVGSSMGGHVAIRVAEKLAERGIQVKKLALISPAAYSANMETATFGGKFKEASASGDPATSLAYPALEKFINGGGAVSLSWAEFDTPILAGVRDRYEQILDLATHPDNDFTLQSFPKVEHGFRVIGTDVKDLVINEPVRQHGTEQIIDFLTAK